MCCLYFLQQLIRRIVLHEAVENNKVASVKKLVRCERSGREWDVEALHSAANRGFTECCLVLEVLLYIGQP